MDLQNHYSNCEESIKNPYSQRVVFFLKKMSNREVHVLMMRFENDPDEWYAFIPSHRPCERHDFICKKISEVMFNEKNEAELTCAFPSESIKKKYINHKGKFIFTNHFLTKATDFDISSILNSSKKKLDAPSNSSIKNQSFNSSFDTLPDAHLLNSNGISVINHLSVDKQSDMPPKNEQHTSNQSSTDTCINNPPNSAENTATNSTTPTIETFDFIKHDPEDFMNDFESKHKMVKNKFVKFGDYLKTEAEKKKVAKACGRVPWEFFKMNFVNEIKDKRRKHFQLLHFKKFEGGNLLEFIEEKFELFEKELIGTPEPIQIKQIIFSLPDRYAKKLCVNIDETKEDFILHLKMILEYDDDEQSNDEGEDDGVNKKIAKEDKVDKKSETTEKVNDSKQTNESVSEDQTKATSGDRSTNNEDEFAIKAAPSIDSSNQQKKPNQMTSNDKATQSDKTTENSPDVAKSVVHHPLLDQTVNDPLNNSRASNPSFSGLLALTDGSSAREQSQTFNYPPSSPHSQSTAIAAHRSKRPASNRKNVICITLDSDDECEDCSEDQLTQTSIFVNFAKRAKLEPKC